MTTETKALLFIYIDAHFTELIRVARVMKASGRYHPVFFFEYQYAVLPRDLETAISEGFDCVVPGWFTQCRENQTRVLGEPAAASSIPAPTSQSAFATFRSRIAQCLPWSVRHLARKVLAICARWYYG